MSHRDSKPSKKDSSLWIRLLTIEQLCILPGEIGGGTYAEKFEGLFNLMGCFILLTKIP